MPSEENCALNSKFWVTKFWLNPKRSLGTQQNVTTFSQYLLFPTMVGLGLITFSQQILISKLLLVLNYDHHLKLCIKKKKTKNQPKKTMSGTMNFGSPNLTKPKKEKKRRNITKWYNIFTRRLDLFPHNS